jgi:hypothetical protein
MARTFYIRLSDRERRGCEIWKFRLIPLTYFSVITVVVVSLHLLLLLLLLLLPSITVIMPSLQNGAGSNKSAKFVTANPLDPMIKPFENKDNMVRTDCTRLTSAFLA